MFYSGMRHALVTALLLVVAASAASAQVGIGVGLSAMAADVRGAAEDLRNLSNGDSISYADVSGALGLYGIFRIKYSYGGIWRFAGDVAYNYFPASNVKLVETSQSGDTTSGVFDIGAALITGSFGFDITIPIEVVRPYLSAQATYTSFNRTFAKVSGSEQLDRAEVRNKWAGSDEWGMAVGAGVEFAAFDIIAMDIGARYNIANFFTTGDAEPSVSYLQIGTTLFFGDLLKSKKELEEEEDEKLGR